MGEEIGRRSGEGLLGGLTAAIEEAAAVSGPAHELTAEDLLSYVNARALAQAKQAEMRKTPRRRPSPADERSPWRGSTA